MAADLQVFSSDSPFSRLPSTGATTPRNTSIPATLPWWQPSPSPYIFFFLFVIWGLGFSPSIPKLSAMPSICFYTNTFVRSRSAFIWYILSGAKLVTATLIWKVGARFAATLGAKKSPHIIPAQDLPLVTPCADGSILCTKTLQTLPRNTCKAP